MKRSFWIPIVSLGLQALGCSASGSDAPGAGNVTGAAGSPSDNGPSSSGNGGSPSGNGASSAGGVNLAMGGSISLTTGGATGEGQAGAAADTCARDTQKAEQLPADLFILLDQSGSMTIEGNRWDPVTTALKAFIQSPTSSGLGVGLQYFPLGASMTEDPAICLPANYVTPAVPLGPLPNQAMALVASIDAHFFTAAQGTDAAHWGTPTLPAVAGALQYLAGEATKHPERRPFLLLATDGLPSKLCAGNSIAGIGMALAAAAAGTPAIQTFVIGIGKLTTLNDLATAGGTGKPAFIVDGVGTTTQTELTAALGEIRQVALPCEYTIPPPTTGKIDPKQVNVEHATDGGASSTFLKVADAAACRDGESDWYYDNDQAPTKVMMCPAACLALKTGGGSIDIVFGCATKDAPR
ncbi:MAG TPA: vWA domain-containing protein [Polyangiaceae bacterium]|nr:vWA domain-containing protein [Polyangiaceae bacterium]